MLNLDQVLMGLRTAAEIATELEGGVTAAQVEDGCQRLQASFPQLVRQRDYLAFLKATGGAHIENAEFSLGVYGFGGQVLMSLDEGPFVDAVRYFQFGDVIYSGPTERRFVFAFDLDSPGEEVLVSEYEESRYVRCRPSFLAFLVGFTEGNLPGLASVD